MHALFAKRRTGLAAQSERRSEAWVLLLGARNSLFILLTTLCKGEDMVQSGFLFLKAKSGVSSLRETHSQVRCLCLCYISQSEADAFHQGLGFLSVAALER